MHIHTQNRKLAASHIFKFFNTLQRNLIELSYGRIWYVLKDIGLFTYTTTDRSHGLHKIAYSVEKSREIMVA